MKLQQLLESEHDTEPFYNYIWQDCLLEQFKLKYSAFLRSKAGKSAKYPALEFIKTELTEREQAQLKEDNEFVERITFTGNVLNTSSSFSFYHYDDLGGPPPFKFGNVAREFSIDRNAMTLKEIPEWFPSSCRSMVLSHTGIETFHNIHKIVKSCQRITTNNTPLKSSIVGLMLIEGLAKFELGITGQMVEDHPIDGAYNDLEKIINDNLTKNPKDAFEFQDELVEGGWKEYAKL